MAIRWASTAAERGQLQQHLAERRKLDADDEARQIVPHEANASVAGALEFTIGRLLQDRPIYLVLGAVAVVVNIADMLLGVWK